MKKLVSVFLVCLLVLTTFSGCKPAAGQGAEQAAAPAATAAETTGETTEATDSSAAVDYQICFVVTGGKLGDQANNDGILSGIQAFCDETGATMTALELAEVSDIDSTTRSMISQGYDLFIYNSADGADLMEELCTQFPDVRFVMHNGTEGPYDNLTNVTNDVADAAFLCGVFAVLMNQNLNGELKAGYIGGVRNPNLERARYAMQAAVEYLGGQLSAVYVGSFNDTAGAKEIAQQMQAEGIRVIQAWAGGANMGVFEAAETAGEGYYSMGGATGQFHLSDSIIASLAMKLDVLYDDICTQAYEGTLASGVFAAKLSNGAIDCIFAPDDRANVIPKEVADKVDEFRQKLISGEMTAPSTEEEYTAFRTQNNLG
ncbi:MAG: BMP family ABC transporter substrate-binding protein [Christensenella sp.]|nr:BMP family ABC transporter substrate-binding protein [Christensenella sp.]